MTTAAAWADLDKDGRIAAIRGAIAEGARSAADIADRLGACSRNAILSYAYRFGIPMPGSKSSSVNGYREPKPDRGAARKLSAEKKAATAVVEPSRPKFDPPEMKHLTLFELTHQTCRWPHGNAVPYTFCGHTPLAGFPYCKFHRGFAYEARPRRTPRPA